MTSSPSATFTAPPIKKLQRSQSTPPHADSPAIRQYILGEDHRASPELEEDIASTLEDVTLSSTLAANNSNLENNKPVAMINNWFPGECLSIPKKLENCPTTANIMPNNAQPISIEKKSDN